MVGDAEGRLFWCDCLNFRSVFYTVKLAGLKRKVNASLLIVMPMAALSPGVSYICIFFHYILVEVVVVVVLVEQTVGSISSRTLAYDCLRTLELCTASMIAIS